MKVLLIDDNPDHRELVEARVRRALPQADFLTVVRQADLDRLLAAPEFDIVMTDFRLNWSDGLRVLAQIKSVAPHVPVIMVTDTGNEEIATEGMKAGLSDYILKGHLQRLPLAVKESLENARLRREHEQALERLRESEERYRLISELSSDYAYAYRVLPDGSFQREWLTQAFSRITGYSESELDAGVLLPYAHPEDRAIVAEGRRRLQQGEPFACEIRILTRGGEVRWLHDHARPVWDAAAGRVVRVLGAGQEITPRKRAEEQRAELIREQAARAAAEATGKRYRSLAEAIPQIVWTAHRDGAVDYFNRRWFEFTGLSEAESYSPGVWKQVLHPDDVQDCLERWSESVRTGQVFEIEYRFRRASDDSYRWHLGRAVPVRDADGRVAEWFGTCTDIDDQKRSQESLREAQKLESIGLLAGGIAHDFNNLLTGIIGNTSLALEELSPNAAGARVLLENAILAGERAADLTRQLLAYSGKGRFFVQPVNLSELVRETSSLIRSSISRRVDLRLDLEENLPMVEADSTQLQQLVMNLVINGAEAIGERTGTVLVMTGTQELTDDEREHNFAVNGIPPGRYVCLEVHDTGDGMDDSIRHRIFDPFFTTKFTGRGLGLAAALGIVRGHNGAIQVESTPGKGSTFRVLLPAIEVREVARPRRPPLQNLRGSGLVLVVDDEEIVRRTVKAALERYGYTILLAEHGREAVAIFERMADRISLVLLDMTMPVMSGEETLVELKRLRPDVVVIASSGYNETVALERFKGKDLAGFIQKPYTAAAVAEKIKRVQQGERLRATHQN